MNYIICNTERKPHFLKELSKINLKESDVVFVFDKEKFNEIFSAKISSNGFVLIDIEANWNKEETENFYGFDIAADLRRIYRVKNQIIFHSTFTSEHFENQSQSDIKFKLMYGRGSSFIRYPFTVEALKEKLLNTTPISVATLHDVVTMLCDLKGIVIDKLNHELRFEKGAASLQQLFASIEPYLSNDQRQLIEMADYLEKLQQSINKDDRTMFLSQKDLFLKLCTRHLTQTGNIESELSKPTHTILLVDDRENELEKYAAELSKDFIVVKTKSGTEAIEILKDDSANNIKAIISDWRLFQDDTLTYWQTLQGYEILEYAAKSGTRALFALTSQADYVVHHIRNLLGIRFSMFKKDNLETADQWKLFKDVLTEACEETTQLISNIPKGTGWTKADAGKKSLHQQYLEKRNSPEWKSFESDITESSNQIWEYYEAFISGALQESLQDFSVRFGIVLKNKIDGVLIARRICIALFFNQGKIYKNILGKNYPRVDVYSHFRNKFFSDFIEENQDKDDSELKGKSLEEYALSKMINASTGLLNTTLCLDVEELAAKGAMLPEERNWIENKGFAIDLQYEKYEDEEEQDENDFPEKEPSAKDIAALENKIGFLDLDTEEDD